MLILSRKLKESIVIGGNIEVTVVEIREGQIKLSISAPRDVPVHRKEVYEEIQKQNIQSSFVSVDTIDDIIKNAER